MIKIRRPKSILSEETRRERLDYRLLKVLAGERQGTKRENDRIKDLQRDLKDDIYIEALYVLTHKIIDDSAEAKSLYMNILEHRDRLSALLGRNVGIEVAALDYMRNILSLLKDPEIIEKRTVAAFLREAMADDKTGAIGYRGLMIHLENEIERAKRYDRPFALLFIDIDDFKKINDEHGHAAGDHVLRKTVELITQTLRFLDRLYRYGGDELVCMLPETDLNAARIVAQRIAQRIAEATFNFEGHAIKITLSIGIAASDPQTMTTAEDLLAHADRAMYRSKQTGKGRISTVFIKE